MRPRISNEVFSKGKKRNHLSLDEEYWVFLDKETHETMRR